VTGAQLRAARGLLNWSVRELAERAKVHRNTISNYERGKYAGTLETVAAIKGAIEKAGVSFINGKHPGVKLVTHDSD
jgi:transcriptional regulator with XRE-family HTH domain